MAELKYRFSNSDYYKCKDIEIIPRDEKMNGDFWGFLEGEGPQIDPGNPDGQIKYFDEPKVQFGNAEQALVSLFYARYSLGQILPNIKKYSGMNIPQIMRLLEGICKDSDRKEFIDKLRECPPRRLYDNEYHELKNIMGRMKGNTRSDKMLYIREMINIHLNNGYEIKERKIDINNRNKKVESLNKKIKSNGNKIDELYNEINKIEIKMKKYEEKKIELYKEIDTINMNIKGFEKDLNDMCTDEKENQHIVNT